VTKEAGTEIVYILECGDGSLYTGWTNDIKKRLRSHQAGKGGKYTRSRLPVKLVYFEHAESRGDALRREAEIKRLERPGKLALIAGMTYDEEKTMTANAENKRFTKADYKAVLGQFASLADEKYRKFNEALIPGTSTAYGVRVPHIRAIAKDIIRTDPLGFLSVCKDATFEEIQLHGLVVAGLKMPLPEKLPYIADFIPLIDNWGICDTCSISVRGKDLPILWEFLHDYFRSDKTYYIRYAVVTGMSNFITDEYIDDYLANLSAITHEDYYVRMAVAWALCDCFIKQRSKTDALLSAKTLDPWTQNKAIQKCRESRRVSPEDKEYLTTLKK
jgi:predicted GIY-YIG superfamily endonuclease/3-methyladenine DNA glycosylase AlkD